MFLYLQETHPQGRLAFFPHLCEFLGLETTVLYLVDFKDETLLKVATSPDEPQSPPRLELLPGLSLRLRSGIPQILTGEEKTQLPNGPVAALPVVINDQTLGVLIQINAPLYDLEDSEFLNYWDHLAKFFQSFLSPALLCQPWSDSQIGQTRKKILGAGLSPLEITFHWEKKFTQIEEEKFPILPNYVVQSTIQVLGDMVGIHGGVFHKKEKTLAIFALNQKMPQDLVLHQIRTALPLECQDIEFSVKDAGTI